MLVPGSMSVLEGHELVERIESGIKEARPNALLLKHLEPAEGPSSFEDMTLEREKKLSKRELVKHN